MEKLSIQQIVECLSGKLINSDGNKIISGVSTDSRKVNPGDLFFALGGVNFDGHMFVESAFEKGAAAIVVSRQMPSGKPQIIVDDTMKALKRLASCYRNKFTIPFIAVTGSTGKTSTKEMIASVLQERYITHKTFQNFNNEIGLPLTLFQLEKGHEISVIEMGMNNLGEIRRLAEISRPRIGVITNIGTAHIENLGSRENIFKAKMEITTFFDNECTLVVNGDDDYLSTLQSDKYEIIKVSTKGMGRYNAVDIANLGEEGVLFNCMYKGEEHEFRLGVPGIHNVYNALVSIAIAEKFNLTISELKQGLLNFKPGKLRMDIIKLDQDIKIINDCYNANLDSMKAALDVLESFKNNRRIAVLGDMFELGDFSYAAHSQVGGYAVGRCDILVAVGEKSIDIFNASKGQIESYYFTAKEEACQFLHDNIKTGDVVLIKASRGMSMEYITNSLINDRKRGV